MCRCSAYSLCEASPTFSCRAWRTEAYSWWTACSSGQKSCRKSCNRSTCDQPRSWKHAALWRVCVCVCAHLDGDDVHTRCEAAVLGHGLLVLGDHHHVDPPRQVVVVPGCSSVHAPVQGDRGGVGGWVLLNVNCLITAEVNLSPVGRCPITLHLDWRSSSQAV